jgi:hypothetical protein
MSFRLERNAMLSTLRHFRIHRLPLPLLLPPPGRVATTASDLLRL